MTFNIGSDPILLWLAPLVVALVMFICLWPISVLRRDVSLVDLVWGPGFIVQLGVVSLLLETLSARAALLLVLVGLWSLRMGVVLGARRIREGHEDPRYQSLRQAWGEGFWWKSLFIVFLLQAVLQWVIVLGPIAGAAAPPQPLGWICWTGAVIAASGLILEATADHQLDRFRRAAPSGSLMTTGLRGIVRHPNYLGEIIFWCGIALISVEGGAWIGLISPILMAIFLTSVSGVPFLDERLSATRPDYAAYKARVPAFIPWTRRKAGS